MPRPEIGLLPERPTLRRADSARVCVCVPTYNEAGNVERLVAGVLAEFERLDVPGDLLIIDDNSPDGTGAIADALAARHPSVHVLHRPGKEGLGRAYQQGLQVAMDLGADLIVQMDCDLSHDPWYLCDLLEAATEADLVIGSRYVRGGAVVDWPLWRRVVSRTGSWYARRMLDLPIRDLTGGYKCFRRAALARVSLEDLTAAGYGYQIESTHRIAMAGLRVAEVPITFRDRTEGTSKMSLAIAGEAARVVVALRRSTASAEARRAARAQRLQRAVSLLALVAALALLAVWGVFDGLRSPGHELLIVLFLLLTAVGVGTLVLMLHAWSRGGEVTAETFSPPDDEPGLSFSLIVPARHEERVLGITLMRLARQRYDRFEVLVVVGHDDPGTRAAAERAIGEDPRFRIVVDHHAAKNKPRALNTALPYCEGDVVGVFDAEDQVALDLLAAVDTRFRETGYEIVQGAVQIMNYDSSWYTLRNVLEYYFWFKSRLHFHAKHRFIPLGGNTVFVRRDVLERADGWDGDCLTEDCELGARLSVGGARTAVAHSAELVTREEAPLSLGALLKQRTRWNQGFLQVLRKQDWRRLPLRPRLLAGYTLAFPFLQAVTALMVPFALAATVVLKLPTTLSLLSFLPLAPMTMIVVAEVVGLRSFCREFAVPVRVRDVVRLVLGTVPYQLLLSVAAPRAAHRELRGVRNWEKTAHVGAHL